MSSFNSPPDHRVFLLPGESTYARKRTEIATLLGSCVAVCLFDRKNHWGGMNHYLLPAQEAGNLGPGKYGDTSINTLFKVAEAAGSKRTDIIASIFGGGAVIGHLGSSQSSEALKVGERNIEMAQAMLRERHVPIGQEDVGGENGRRIYMDSETNEIRLKLIESSVESRARSERLQTFRKRKIRVLLIDDSSIVRQLIRKGIANVDDMEIVGEAEHPYDAREKILELDPDVLCLDIIMPRLDGISFLEKVMQYKPIPTVIVSTIAKRGSAMYDSAIKAGAVEVIDKEELEIYKSPDIVEQVLAPALRKAARTVLAKTS